MLNKTDNASFQHITFSLGQHSFIAWGLKSQKTIPTQTSIHIHIHTYAQGKLYDQAPSSHLEALTHGVSMNTVSQCIPCSKVNIEN